MERVAALYGAGQASLKVERVLRRYLPDMRAQYLVENRDFGKLGTTLARGDGAAPPLEVISLADLKKLYAGGECQVVVVPGSYSVHDLREIGSRLDGIGIDRADVFAMPYNRLAAPLETEDGNQPFLVPLDALEQIWSLDVHVADHCNLRCKACGHFSCLVDGEVFYDAETVGKSLERLAVLVPNICNLHILGGEPLLHPELPEIVAVVRRHYPFASMTMATNGILRTRMALPLRSSLKNNRVKVIVSLYPPLLGRVDELSAWLRSEEVAFQINRIDSFERRLLSRPIFDKRRMFAKCGHNMCLRGSRVGYCVMALFTDYYNRRFGPGRLPEDRGVDVFAHADGKSFLAALNQPLELCRHCVACDAGRQYFRDWEPAGKDPRPEDWFIDFPLDAAPARRGD